MNTNSNQENEIQVPLNTSDPVNTNNKKCSYCNKLFIEELWCKECDPYDIIEEWTSGNPNIDKFIKDTMYKGRNSRVFLDWVPFDRFTDIKQIGEGGFAKVYSAIWKDGKIKKIGLKRLNESQNMSVKYLNKLIAYWNICLKKSNCLKFYGMTKDPETREFMIIIQFADEGNLRDILLSNFNNISWNNKLRLLEGLAFNLKTLHELGYSHKNFHSGNILHNNKFSYISDFGLFGPANEQNSDDKIYGVLPYIAPEVLNGKPYTSSSDIYSFGVIMVELSSGMPPFYDRKHDLNLALDICNGLRPEFGNGTPEIYKKLAYRCMNANPDQRPLANELYEIFELLRDSTEKEEEKPGYKKKEIKAIFDKADKEIRNISILYEKDPKAVYTSHVLTFKNLPKPVNLSIIALYFEKVNYISCSYCNKLFIKELWCKECDPYCLIEGWTSENSDIDKFIKDTMYQGRRNKVFLEWIPFDRFTIIEQIGEGGFAKVYSASWKDHKDKKVVLKRLNESQDMSAKNLNELKIHWDIALKSKKSLNFYGMTKDSETEEYMMIIEFANEGNLRNTLSNNFNSILWKDKIDLLCSLITELQNLHNLGYLHKDFHSGNILQNDKVPFISDFGLSGPVNEKKSDDKIYGVLPYVAPEVLNGKPHTSSSDIYSFGIIMVELSTGTPPFHDKKHDLGLTLNICDGLRPEFGKGTPNIYKKLAHRCMNGDPNQRPTAIQLYEILNFWNDSINSEVEDYQAEVTLCQKFVDKNFDYNGKKIKVMFEEADKEISNISTLYKKDPNAIYSSRILKPISSSSCFNDKDCQDSKLVGLDFMSIL